jgi:hypothetical protein
MMSLFCNKTMVSNICSSGHPLILQSNGGLMQVTKMVSIGKAEVWFSTKAITNILLLKEVIKLYHVTYNGYKKAFIVWREQHHLPNMIFKMH